MSDYESTDIRGAAYLAAEASFDPGPEDNGPSREECADLEASEPRVFPRCPMGDFAWRCARPDCSPGFCAGRRERREAVAA